MTPSAWVVRFAPCVPAGGTVLDVACGAGRHTRLFLQRGHPVVAVDRDTSGLADLAGDPRLRIIEADLEDGGPFPLSGRRFHGVVVTSYLHRPLLGDLVSAVAPGGALVYETFARGQERLGRPTNPDFLLRPGELLDAVRGRLRVVAYEDLTVDRPPPARVQRICAVAPPGHQGPTQVPSGHGGRDRRPILNRPFEEPERHFRFDEDGITGQVVHTRRPSSYFVPIPAFRKRADTSPAAVTRPVGPAPTTTSSSVSGEPIAMAVSSPAPDITSPGTAV